MKITRSKSQISIEFLLILGILTLVLLSVLIFSAMMQRETEELRENFEKTEECLGLARRISVLYANGDGGEFRIKTKNNIEFREKEIIIDEVSCSFIANLKEEATLNGSIAIKNMLGEIIVENYEPT